MNTGKTELHLHLDGSLDLTHAYETSKKRGVISEDTTFEEYYDSWYTKWLDRAEGFKKFDIPINVMQTKEDLYAAGYQIVKILNDKGLFYAEVRLASQQHCKLGLTQLEVLEATAEGVNDALKECPDIQVNLINCLMHKGENALFNQKENEEAIEATYKMLGKGVVGLDLAGYENNGDFMLYAPLFEKARALGIPYTIHAGEMGLGEHVGMAIKMGAHRIGHGVNCVQNPEWLQEVVDKQIPLEVCVTSNCGDGRNYAAHPVRKLLEAGVKVTLSSDNMTFSRTDIIHEHAMLKAIGVSEEMLIKTQYNAAEAAFCTEEQRKKLIAQLDNYFGK